MTTQLISDLSQWSGLRVIDVEYIVRSAPRRYKVFSIPKRNGGERVVAQPSKEVKLLQTLIVHRVLHDLPVHNAAHGYVKGRGIKSNASMHVNSNYILKMDLTNFFPSIRPRDLENHLRRHAPEQQTEVERRQLFNLVFWRPRGQRDLRLCIGAPSSPFLSNTLMFELDLKISELCDQFGVVYTRYADDLTFSCAGKSVLGGIQNRVTDLIERTRSPNFSVNVAKTVHMSRAHRRTITGINISSVGVLSLGRERKRLIRAMVHRYVASQLSPENISELKGLLAFAHDVEPEFASKMRARLSDE